MSTDKSQNKQCDNEINCFNHLIIKNILLIQYKNLTKQYDSVLKLLILMIDNLINN